MSAVSRSAWDLQADLAASAPALGELECLPDFREGEDGRDGRAELAGFHELANQPELPGVGPAQDPRDADAGLLRFELWLAANGTGRRDSRLSE